MAIREISPYFLSMWHSVTRVGSKSQSLMGSKTQLTKLGKRIQLHVENKYKVSAEVGPDQMICFCRAHLPAGSSLYLRYCRTDTSLPGNRISATPPKGCRETKKHKMGNLVKKVVLFLYLAIQDGIFTLFVKGITLFFFFKSFQKEASHEGNVELPAIDLLSNVQAPGLSSSTFQWPENKHVDI